MIFLVRHGETEWSRTGQHTGRSDIALTERGQAQAEALGRELKGKAFTVWSSPLQRARETCRLAGFDPPLVDPDLLEWDYGAYEGLTTTQIRAIVPGWSVWNSPIVNGETLEQVGARAQAVIDRAASVDGDVAIFAHGHILRILTACWLGLPPALGRAFALETGTLSVLGYERETRVIRHWNIVPNR